MTEIYRKKRGDRRDGRWISDTPGLQTIMALLMPNRTDCEVCLRDQFDVTELLKYLEEKNSGRTDEKMTLFHCVIMAATKMVMERPKMNRFVQGGRTYERDEISSAFVCKRRFTDHSEEALMVLVPKDTDTINEISKKIIGDVRETRKSETANGGIDSIMDAVGKLPRLLLMAFIQVVRWLDYWGMVPKILTEGDPNYTTLFFSNLGSIKCPSVYNHLNNYGTNSIMITIGTIRKEEKLMEDGSKQIRDVVDFTATLDERIADGFYFARSLKLIKYLFANPQMLERPLNEPSGFDYNTKY